MRGSRWLAFSLLPLGVVAWLALGAGTTGCNDGQCAKGLDLCGVSCRDLEADVQNCGACGVTCAAGQICSNGVCCEANEVACNGRCIDPQTNIYFCGARGDCYGIDEFDNPGDQCRDDQTCTGGVCVCVVGVLECDRMCIDPQSDPDYCGAVDNCRGQNRGELCRTDQVCQAGVCACDTGQIECGGACIDPQTDEMYCGASGDCSNLNAGVTCTGERECEGGQCVCRDDLVDCDGVCVDPLTDNTFCGATGDCQDGNRGVTCVGLEQCVNGVCTVLR